MLVLSRKVGEEILIGDEVSISVSRINGNRVTLAIRAPRHVHIVRAELPPEPPAAVPPREVRSAPTSLAPRNPLWQYRARTRGDALRLADAATRSASTA